MHRAEDISYLKTPSGHMLLDPAEIQEDAISFYTELLAAKPVFLEAIQHLHKGLPKFSMSKVDKLEQELSLTQMTATVEGLTTGRQCTLMDYLLNSRRPCGLDPDLLCNFQESLEDGVLPVSWQVLLILLPKKGDLGNIKN